MVSKAMPSCHVLPIYSMLWMLRENCSTSLRVFFLRISLLLKDGLRVVQTPEPFFLATDHNRFFPQNSTSTPFCSFCWFPGLRKVNPTNWTRSMKRCSALTSSAFPVTTHPVDEHFQHTNRRTESVNILLLSSSVLGSSPTLLWPPRHVKVPTFFLIPCRCSEDRRDHANSG